MKIENYKSLRTDSIEKIGKEALKIFLGLNDGVIDEYEQNVRMGNPTKSQLERFVDTNKYYTPDLIISENFKTSNLFDLCFIDFNEPEGDALNEIETSISQLLVNAQNSLKVDEAISVIVNPSGNPINRWVLNKLKKINKTYARNRNKKGKTSINNGIVFCMGDKRHITNKGIPFNLSQIQIQILLSQALIILSDGKCGFGDIQDKYRNEIISFKFTEEYRNIGFIFVLGRESFVNNSYFIVNDDFFLKSNNIVCNVLKNKRIGNGNIFRKPDKRFQEQIVIDLHNALIEKDDFVFPYGNSQYQGDSFQGMNLDQISNDKVNASFERGFKNRKSRD